MIKKREFVSDLNPNTLCETYSSVGADLLQVETGITYGSSVVDVLAGYDEGGNPYSPYTYTEVGETDGEITLTDALEALSELGVSDDDEI